MPNEALIEPLRGSSTESSAPPPTRARMIGEMEPGTSVALGNELYIESVEIAGLKEQDVNAHIMPMAKFNRLVENIRKSGQLESLPYCAQPDRTKPIEVVSGHHRVRAARAAGLTHVVVLVDRKPITRSQIIAKQLAHNALVGYDDMSILKTLVERMTTVDDLLESGLDESALPTAEQFKVTLFTPHADYQWKFCTFTFLPHQMTNAKELVKAAASKTDLMLVGTEEQFKQFIESVAEFARRKEILSASTAVAVLIETALKEIGRLDAAAAEAAVTEDPQTGEAAAEVDEPLPPL